MAGFGISALPTAVAGSIVEGRGLSATGFVPGFPEQLVNMASTKRARIQAKVVFPLQVNMFDLIGVPFLFGLL
jgi:hypothetical protein